MQGKLNRPKEFGNIYLYIYIESTVNYLHLAYPKNIKEISVSVSQLAMWRRIEFKIICQYLKEGNNILCKLGTARIINY